MSDQAALDLGAAPAPPQTPSASQPAPIQPPAPQAPRQPVTQGHSPARDQRAAHLAPAGPSTDGAAKIKVGDVEYSPAQLQDIAQRQATEDSKRLTLPTKPEEYQIALPADFAIPEGVTFEIDANDPRAPELQQFAHRHGLSQAAMSELVAIDAGKSLAEQTHMAAAAKTQIDLLGPNGPARVDAVTRWLKGVGGDDAATLIKVLEYAPVAGTVQAFERMMQKFSSQGNTAFSQSHRSQPDPMKIEGYETMSFEQKRAAQENNRARQR